MILIEDRRSLATDIATAHSAGALLRLACEIAGIDERTLQRWKAHAGLPTSTANREIPSFLAGRPNEINDLQAIF